MPTRIKLEMLLRLRAIPPKKEGAAPFWMPPRNFPKLFGRSAIYGLAKM